LFAGAADITGNFTADTSVAGAVTFVPVAGKVGYTNQALTATVADAAGNASVASTPSATYTFANAIEINANNAATTFKAAGANYQYTLAEGDYKATIDGFGAGDRLVFKASVVPSVEVNQILLTDGFVDLSAPSGAGVVELKLLGIGNADSQLLFPSSFDVFGPNTLETKANVIAAPLTPVAISATSAGVFDASGGNFAYTVSEGQYLSTIKNFGAGDTINFAGSSSKPVLQLGNENLSDGSVLISANFGTGVVDLTLSELQPATIDQSANFISDLNLALGAGTIISSVTGQAASQSVSISASNASTVQNAAGGNFTYKFAEGSYKAQISGFTSGDSLEFFGQKVAGIELSQDDYKDGNLLITATTSEGSVVDLTLSGLATEAEVRLIFPSSFDLVFGTGSLIA
jgi:hypothetical protein